MSTGTLTIEVTSSDLEPNELRARLAEVATRVCDDVGLVITTWELNNDGGRREGTR